MSSVIPVTATFTFPRRAFIHGIPRMNFYAPDVTREDVPVREFHDKDLGFKRLYTDNDELLVLLAAGYGSPWSAESCGCPTKVIRNHLLMDAHIVKFFYDTYIAPLAAEPRKCRCGMVCSCTVDEAPMRQFLVDYFKSLGFEEKHAQHIYLGGLRNLQIAVVPVGKKFRVTEYDGMESLMFYNPESWHSS